MREAYKLAIEDDNNASGSNGFDPVWNHIWRLDVPPKVSNFLWRAAWDILPHNLNLRCKRVMTEVKCVRCEAAENAVHVLRDCAWARHFWSLEGVEWRYEAATNFKEWLAWIFATFTKEKQEDFAVRVWKVWGCRNEF